MNEASPIVSTHTAVPVYAPAAGARRGRQDRRAAGQSRHARRRRCGVGAPLSQGIPLRSAGDREPGPAVAARAQRRHPADPAAAQGARLRQDLEPGAERDPRSRPSPARRRRSSAPRSRRAGRTSWSTGRCATAIPRSRRGSRDLVGARLRAHPGRSRSIRNTAPRPRRRWATRCFACSSACASSRRCASRRPITTTPRLYRGARVHHRALRSPASISSPTSSSRRSTACRRPMSTRAIPITPNASRPCGCCARGSVSTRRSCC